MKSEQFKRASVGLLQAAGLFGLCSYRLTALAAIGLALVQLSKWWPNRLAPASWSRFDPWLIGSLSLVGLISLAPGWPTKLVFGLMLAALLIASKLRPSLTDREELILAAFNQFFGLSAIFLAGTIWHWPVWLIITLTWIVSFAVAGRLLKDQDRARLVIASAWSLICAEIAWVFAVWLVNYTLVGGQIVIPQAALVLTALGYCFGHIYQAHASGRLSKARLAEYLIIGLSLIAIVAAGTKWNSTI